ncbi:MAG: hypothetical protein KGL74_01050, partial [Elusimicrobia bacterium]|nr:hypothetical protein [Elusimicrobiota bacterium]
IKATLASLKSARQEMTSEQEKFHDGLASFLTPTQQAKMVLGMAKHMREGMMQGPGGRGWRGRGGERPSPKDQDDDKDDDDGGK